MGYYSRKTVSDILAVSGDTLRYFEDIGIVSPEINPHNHYRLYSELDMLKVSMYRYYRSFGFSQEESRRLCTLQGTEDIEQNNRAVEQKLQEQIDRLSGLKRYTRSVGEWLKKARQGQAVIRWDQMKSFHCIEIRNSGGYVTDPKTLEAVRRWTSNFPFVTYYTRYETSQLREQQPSYVVGLAVLGKWEPYTNLDFRECTYVKECKALHTYQDVRQHGSYPKDSFVWIADYLEEHQIRARYMYTFQIVNYMKKDKECSLYDVYIPAAE